MRILLRRFSFTLLLLLLSSSFCLPTLGFVVKILNDDGRRRIHHREPCRQPVDSTINNNGVGSTLLNVASSTTTTAVSVQQQGSNMTHTSTTTTPSTTTMTSSTRSSSSSSTEDETTSSFETQMHHYNVKNEEEERFPQYALHYDSYSGVIVHVRHLEEDVSTTVFTTLLKSSLQKWKREQRRGIWIHIPKSHGHLIPPCLSTGFDFHSCSGANNDVLILKRWLPSHTASRLPLGPTHQVGIGALVLNTQRTKMLCVQEKSGPAAAARLWKMPTGLLDPGEDVGEAAVRQLKEETGLDGTLQRVLCMRQAHNHGSSSEGTTPSDLFFICLLTLDDHDQTPVLQEEEIAQLQWMSPNDYANQDLWKQSPVYQELNASILRAARHETAGMVEVKLPVGFRPGTNTLYMSKI